MKINIYFKIKMYIRVYVCVSIYLSIGLTKKFVWIFLLHLAGKPKPISPPQ